MDNYNRIDLTMPKWKAQLMMSLFNGEGTKYFQEEDLAEANSLVCKLGLKELVAYEDIDDARTKCYFESIPTDSSFWILKSEDVKRQYLEYGQFPYTHEQNLENNSQFVSGVLTENIKKRFPEAVFVENIQHKLLIWWKAQPDHIKQILSVLPYWDDSWHRLSLATKLDIYRYCIAKENKLPLTPERENIYVSSIAQDLSIIAMQMLIGESPEEMTDGCGDFKGSYKKLQKRIHRDISRLIRNIDLIN